jgi:hypothetical protein
VKLPTTRWPCYNADESWDWHTRRDGSPASEEAQPRTFSFPRTLSSVKTMAMTAGFMNNPGWLST